MGSWVRNIELCRGEALWLIGSASMWYDCCFETRVLLSLVCALALMLCTGRKKKKKGTGLTANVIHTAPYFINFSCCCILTGGMPTGTLCGEPSAPLRRCQQPLLFPKNPQPELTTIHNSGAALVWTQRQEVQYLSSSVTGAVSKTEPQPCFGLQKHKVAD